MIFLDVVSAPADAVAAHNLSTAVAEGRGPVATVVLVLPGFGAPSHIPVTTGP